jgi:hypothetical protein
LAFVGAATLIHRQDINAYIYYILYPFLFISLFGGGAIVEAEKRGACRNFPPEKILFDEESFWNIPLQIEYSNPN